VQPESSQTSVASEPLENPPRPVDEAVPDPEEHDGGFVHPGGSHLPSAKRKRALSDIHGDRSNLQNQSGMGKPHETNSPPSLRLSLSFDGEAQLRKEGELTPSPPKGRKALRIAMSSDGKAVVRAEGEPSPSKNRIAMFSARKPRGPGLRRSNSAVVLGASRNAMTEKDRIFGRSRDPRNWESFVDTDARSALTPSSSQGAPKDSPGLLHPKNQRPLHRSLSARQNSLAGNSADRLNPPVAQQMGEKRRKLSRTVSSLGRLETGRNLPTDKPSARPLKASKLQNSKNADEDLEADGGDSDKENWIPGTRTSRIRRRMTHTAQRPALKDASNRDGRANRNLGAVSSGKRSRVHQGPQRTNSHGDISADVSAFMAGGSGPSQEEDLDCIHGLLSLSQGAWR
jgi:hypothetical protein